MTEIPKEALQKANEIAGHTSDRSILLRNFASYIADVSEKAKAADETLDAHGYKTGDEPRDVIRELILPNPEDDLLKEAREICAGECKDFPQHAAKFRSGAWDSCEVMRCTLAALRKGRE